MLAGWAVLTAWMHLALGTISLPQGTANTATSARQHATVALPPLPDDLIAPLREPPAVSNHTILASCTSEG